MAGAIQKGLRRQISEVVVLQALGDEAVDAVKQAIAASGSRAVVGLGAAAARLIGRPTPPPRGALEAWGEDRRLLFTHALHDVLNDVRKKREFWADLQLVMFEIGWNAQ